MSHADPGPLATYNSLQDKHLSGYFSNSRMKRQLRRSGLVTKSGKIIDERTYRLNMAKKEHRKHVRDLLATAIVHKTLDMERMRQYEIRKRLDEVYKIELVKRVKEDRKRKGDEDILPLLSPRQRTTARQMHKAKQANGDLERPATAPLSYADYRAEEETPLQPSELVYDQDMGKILYRTNPSTLQSGNGYLLDETEELGPSPYTRAYSSTYPAPAPPPSGTPQHARRHSTPRRGVRLQRFHYLAKTEPAVAHRIQLQSMAEVTMKFLGPSLVLTNSMFPQDRLSEVMVLQQHCGGSTLCVFRELLPANTIFTFISRRHRGAPFGLTFYIDGMQDIRLSSCCEYKHKPGHVLGGKNGHFQFVVVEGAAPCYRCQVASSYSKKTKRKNKASQQLEAEEDENRRAFLTETANDEEEAGETFDVIITKINPHKSEEDESKDAEEMVDNSTQTPRGDDDANDKRAKEGEINSEEATLEVTPDQTEQEGGGDDEPGSEKYDDDDFENDEEKEKEENERDGEAKEENDNEDQETRGKDEYNEDFESEDAKEEDESEVEEEKESDHKEESEDEILDETEETQQTSAVIEKEEEEPKEVDDETEEIMPDSSDRPGSATDSEDKLGKSVSFDEDVTVIEDDKEEAAKTIEDVPEEEGAEDDQGKPEDEQETNKAAPDDDSKLQAEEVSEEEKEPRLEDQEVSKQAEEVNELPQESLNETQDEIKQFEELILSRELDDSNSSSESSESSKSSESSEGSDNEDKENTMKKRKKKHKSKPGHDPGSDPDLVSTGTLPEQALKAVGVQPGTKHEGSVQSLLEGKEDVDLAGVSLTRKQLEEVASIVLARDYVGSVVLRNTGVDDHSIQRLCTAVKNAPTTKMLNLSVNQIGPAGARHIADVIRENKALRMLLLHGNPLTNEGVQVIVDAILETPDTSLLNLDLGDCGVGDDGAKSISKLIASNRTISQLTISGNNIGHNGWLSIGEALKANTTLGTLSLDFNKIGDEEAAIIAEGLRDCKSLRCVDLEGNKIGDDGGRKLLEAVKANRSVIDLTLMPVNHISEEILDELKEVLEERVKKGSEAEGDGERNDIHGSVQEEDTEAELKGEAGKTRENAVQGNQQHEEQTEGEEMGPGTKDSAEVPIVEESKNDEEEVNREKDAKAEDVLVGKDSDHYGEGKDKADEQQQPSGSGPGEEEQENTLEPPENLPHKGETDKYLIKNEPQADETEKAPLERVSEPLETGQSPPESVPQPSKMERSSVEGISQQSETGQNPSEGFQQSSGTKQEWRLEQNVLEEGKKDYASEDSALPEDQETTPEGPAKVGESSANKTEVDKGSQEESHVGDGSERVITALTEQT